ncbi:hypothetical protein LTR53_000074 [Teratosphaeriaceae sp. CCFEE 6253]|nr:hypothetical protein LTR53_000074 [Teratosphaeriaceae sp. CCFEE 6253]
MQVTSYQQGQQYRPHWDWFLEPNRTTNRLSTFFAITAKYNGYRPPATYVGRTPLTYWQLEADCENCGTQFPKIRADWSQRDQRWCEIVDCSQEVLTTRNIPGGAVFWRNLDNEGEGRDDVLHAGLPALNGSKIGLNIWTDVDLDRFKASKEGSTVLRP